MFKVRVGDLFCGAGGFSLGALQTGKVEIGWAVDIDLDACLTYQHNISPAVRCEDVRRLDPRTLPYVDGLLFGFPCNDFSIIGKKAGLDGTYGSLYAYAIETLSVLQPLWFVAENVPGLRSIDGGNAIVRVVNDMIHANYRVSWQVYRLDLHGVPQTRRRIFFVGIRDDLPYVYIPPQPLGVIRTARQALEEPPIPPDAPNHELVWPSERVQERLSYIKPGENAFNAQLPEQLKLNTRTSRSLIYRRLDPDKPSYTVTASGGGGTHIYHWSENRALTNRERARLQTFPDDFVFCGSRESVRRQIGMAVPPLAAKIVIGKLLHDLRVVL